MQIDGQVKPTNIKYESSVNCNTIFNNLSQVQTQGSMLRKSMLSNLIIVYPKTKLRGRWGFIHADKIYFTVYLLDF